MTQTDWPRLIDAAFDDGPAPGPDPSTILAGGRRALRRRRARRLTGVAAAAVLAVAAAPALGGLLADHDPGTATDAPVATSRPSFVRGPATSDGEETSIVTSAGPVTYQPTTETLTLPVGWREVERVTRPLGAGSLAAEITDGTDTLFLCLTGAGGRSSGVVAAPDDHLTSLPVFVREAKRMIELRDEAGIPPGSSRE